MCFLLRTIIIMNPFFFNCIDDDPKYDKMSRTKDRAANIEDSSVGFTS